MYWECLAIYFLIEKGVNNQHKKYLTLAKKLSWGLQNAHKLCKCIKLKTLFEFEK